jgi:hypothetical protein
MIYTIVISSVNYSGETADITFSPYTGGTINIGLQTLPYNYTTTYYWGEYELYFPTYDYSCYLIINPEGFYILQENGDYLLQEDDSKIVR